MFNTSSKNKNIQQAHAKVSRLFANIPDVQVAYSLMNERIQVSGPATKEYKEQLKALGFWWDGYQKVWFFPGKPYRKADR